MQGYIRKDFLLNGLRNVLYPSKVHITKDFLLSGLKKMRPGRSGEGYRAYIYIYICIIYYTCQLMDIELLNLNMC